MAEQRIGSIEEAYNFSLAELLRQQGINAEGEVKNDFAGTFGRTDVSVDIGDSAIVLEAEFGKPAKSDADKRLPSDGNPALIQGLPIRMAIAIGYPERFKDHPESESKDELRDAIDLRITSRRFKEEWGEEVEGSVADLAAIIKNYWVAHDRTNEIDEIVQIASEAISNVSDLLFAAKQGSNEECSMKALIWLNALLFQSLLSRHLDTSKLPLEHVDKRIDAPDPEFGAEDLILQWASILEINWWPIFQIAKDTLKQTPPPLNNEAIAHLKPAVYDIAGRSAIRQHDLAGRILHRLLDTRKFLATNYTTIPAAILLAGLAFDPRHPTWKDVDFNSIDSISKLRIVDPACGSGTLLMAAVQEIMKRCDSHDTTKLYSSSELTRTILEEAVYGFDVVPAAVHIAASTLCMAETSQVVSNLKLWRLRHDAGDPKNDDVVRLGSLDFLDSAPSKGNAALKSLFAGFDYERSQQITGSGEKIDDRVEMPEECNLFIANPPYTRAGGPGDEKNTEWNPIFGFMNDKQDADTMKSALNKTLENTPASMTAGLGSAFFVLADRYLDYQGLLAFILPMASITGDGWRKIRKTLLQDYVVNWVITSHDRRKRSKTKLLPGRYWTSFSESTSMSEVLILATKKNVTEDHRVRFLNLIENPDDPISALTLLRSLLSIDEDDREENVQVRAGGKWWGDVFSISQSKLSDDPWMYSAFVQSRILEAVEQIDEGVFSGVPLIQLEKILNTGPYHSNIKGRKQGLFDIYELSNNLQPGTLALWHHSGDVIRTLEADHNATLERRSDKSKQEQAKMIKRCGRLHYSDSIRFSAQRIGAVISRQAMLGVRSWITLEAQRPTPGKEEALCLWFNSTFGILTRLMYGNRPYLGRTEMNHSLLKKMLILDVDRISSQQLRAVVKIYESLKMREFLPFKELDSDSARSELNKLLCTEVLGVGYESILEISELLAKEPSVTG